MLRATLSRKAMQDAAGMLTLQFLAWVSTRPRTYDEAI
jgi:hypothetical protein